MPYSSALWSFASTGSGIHLLFTAPAGYVTVIRDIRTANLSGASEAYSLYVTRSPGTPTVFLAINGSLGNDNVDVWDGRQVLEAGDSVSLSIGGADFTCVGSGYLLTSP